MSKLYTMVGLPGAGKSTFTKNHPECVVVSSDAVRAELFGDEAIQGDATKVFAVVNARVHEALNNGFDVIYDATSLTKKIRRNIIHSFNAEHIAVFVNTPVDECIRRDALRARTVGANVIQKMALRLSAPTVEEGFNSVITL